MARSEAESDRCFICHTSSSVSVASTTWAWSASLAVDLPFLMTDIIQWLKKRGLEGSHKESTILQMPSLVYPIPQNRTRETGLGGRLH